MRRFYPLLQSCTSKWASRNWYYKGPLWHKGGIYDDWGHYHLILLQLCGIKQHSLDGKQQRFEWNSMKPATTKGDWNWIEIGIFTICGDKDVKGQRMSFDLLQPLIEFRIIWRQQPIIWRKLWFLTLKDSMAYGGSLANFPIFPEPNLGISWEFHDIAGKKPDDYQERIGNSSRRLGFSPTRIGLEKSSNSSKKMKMLTNKTVVWTRRMGSPWITWGIETQRRDIKQQWNSQQWDGDWTTIKDVICWLAHTVQHRVPCTSRWLDLRENIQEVRCSTMRIYRNLAKNNLFHMNWRDRRLQAQISIAGPQLNLGTIEGAITSATAHVRMKKRNSSHRYFLENCGLTRQDWCIEPV